MLKPEPNHPGQVIFSTEGMSSQESFERWRDLYKGSTMTTRIEAGGTGNFTAQTRVQAIGELGLLSKSSAGWSCERAISDFPRLN